MLTRPGRPKRNFLSLQLTAIAQLFELTNHSFCGRSFMIQKSQGGNQMKSQRKNYSIFLILIIGIAIGGLSSKKEVSPTEISSNIDKRSYNLGIIGAFSEVVALRVKKLALSAPLSPEEISQLIKDAKSIADDHGVSLYLEKKLLITDLFPEELTKDKYILLIYLEPVLEEYLALKTEKDELIKAGRYRGEARKEIARKLGRLLSYPEDQIEKLLSERKKQN